MATKKKAKKHSKRRRSISGVGNVSGVLMQIAGIAGGAFAASLINRAAGPSLNPRILNFGLIGAGALLVPKVLKGPMGASVGSGLVAVGTIAALQSFGVIRGIGETETMTIAVNGTDDTPLIAGGDDFDDSVSGMDLISGLEVTDEEA